MAYLTFFEKMLGYYCDKKNYEDDLVDDVHFVEKKSVHDGEYHKVFHFENCVADKYFGIHQHC